MTTGMEQAACGYPYCDIRGAHTHMYGANGLALVASGDWLQIQSPSPAFYETGRTEERP